ncbi:N,N-dimethylformamidase beta subunit family domain-containing protein [Mesorhizobium sp. M0244]|uniref:N,N-dimethylformamidase beta subunit family domain-containing protein n=1 Tax=Mesorhizobium sp. M0244 TaxID=2956926 RepID=UPI0033379DF3
MSKKVSAELPEQMPSNFVPRRQGLDGVKTLYYETVFQDPAYLEVFTYTDRMSYRPGETVRFHTSTTAERFDISIVRDGIRPQKLAHLEGISGKSVGLRDRFYERGCDWPESQTWRVPDDAPAGFYIVTSVASKGDVHREQEHGFFVLPRKDQQQEILLVAATGTWRAYNDWGGYSHYYGHNLTDGWQFAPKVTLHRPWARGFLWLPPGAPRRAAKQPTAIGSPPRYLQDEFAFSRGFSKFCGSAGWASYERPFLCWAEAQGLGVDVVSQADMIEDPGLLSAYKCVVFVGHDEYWTWEMREAIEQYIESGGNVARFAGNFHFQIRLEDGGITQVCYKDRVSEKDPLAGTKDEGRVATDWSDPRIGWPGEQTFGLSSEYGCFAGVGGNVARGSGGFTIYDANHWAFEGLYLGYGDVIGAEAQIFGYEVDGLDYEMIDGIPRPSARMKTPYGLRILAMGLASNVEQAYGRKGESLKWGDEDLGGFALRRYGVATEGARAAAARGSGMIVAFQKGLGSVFHAGSCEWVAGLQQNDPATSHVTRNVLDRFTR